MFLTDLDRDHVDIRPIRKMGRNAVSSNELFIDDRGTRPSTGIGEEGKGSGYIPARAEPERMLIAAEALASDGRAGPRSSHANERVVFDRADRHGTRASSSPGPAGTPDAAELILRKATWLTTMEGQRAAGKPAGGLGICVPTPVSAAVDRVLQTHGHWLPERAPHLPVLRGVPADEDRAGQPEMILNFLVPNASSARRPSYCGWPLPPSVW